MLKARGIEHDAVKCQWSDVMTGVAWSVWHNKELFSKMKRRLDCPVDDAPRVKNPIDKSGKASTNPEDKVNKDRLRWVEWLRNHNPHGTAYNLHELWLWYGSEVMNGSTY